MTASTNTNALVPYGVRPSDEVMETLASTVSKSTRAVYIRECVNFTTWLYDKDSDHFIHYEYLPSLRLAHESDEEQGLQKSTRNLRSTISELVSEVNEADRNCPIVQYFCDNKLEIILLILQPTYAAEPWKPTVVNCSIADTDSTRQSKISRANQPMSSQNQSNSMTSSQFQFCFIDTLHLLWQQFKRKWSNPKSKQETTRRGSN